MDPEKFQRFLIDKGSRWVEEEKARQRRDASPLSQEVLQAFRGFFDDEILKDARIKVVTGLENPAFYSEFKELDLSKILDFRTMMALTFDNTIVISQKSYLEGPPSWPMLFHELVHVVQYQVLGIRRFMENYVRGWVGSGMNYFFIPIETQAYELQARYVTDTSEIFSVRREVEGKFSSG